ncbi:MAG TPA: hypothetical protein VFM02_01005 [Candidatus Paceibacterota bacterium]|nr:hypothetical protein [Candidatus Paceibacterota bacterium]
MNPEYIQTQTPVSTGLPGQIAPQPTIDPTQVFSHATQAADPNFFAIVLSVIHGFEVFLSFLSIFFMLVIIYVVIQRNRLFMRENALHKTESEEPKKVEEEKKEEEGEEKEEKSSHPRFDRVLEHLNAGNEAQWRVAIIEADNILYEILRRAGFPGETLGEMLTNANPQAFRTLEDAWEAHKIRNMIAHQGFDFRLNRHEAHRVINLYKKVFEEFDYL